MKKENHFRSHIPPYCSGFTPEEIPFDTQEELLSHAFFKDYKEVEQFDGFFMSDNHLMYTSNKGTRWWVIGYILHPHLMDLPPWIPVDTREDYLNGRCHPKSAEIVLRQTISTMKALLDFVEITGSEEVNKYFSKIKEDFLFAKKRLEISLNMIQKNEFEEK